jgi:hypothetical protein
MNATLDHLPETRMPKSNPQTSIKIDKDLIDMLAIIKTATGENMSDCLSRHARPGIERECKKAMQQLQKRLGSDSSPSDD